MKNQGILEAVSRLFDHADTILLTAAENLDGDALGCLLALEAYGRSKGKDVVVVNSCPVSPLYGFLNASDRIQTEIPRKDYDLVIVCDTGDLSMIGRVYDENREFFETVPLINIDHHGSHYGNVCWMDPTYSAACDMVAEFIEYDGGLRAVTPEIATFLLLGVLYDTACYRNTNTTAATFERSARLLAHGADHIGLIRNLLQSTPVAYSRLYGEAMTNLVPIGRGRGVAAIMTNEMFLRHEIDAGDLGHEFVNDYLRSVKADFVVLIKEMPDGEKRLSFRSKHDAVDMRVVAGQLGGGGHKMASGARSKLSTVEILAVVEAFEKSLP